MKIEDLKNTKIYLHSIDEKVVFKNKLEKLGVRWRFWSECDPVTHDDIPFVFINEDFSLGVAYKRDYASFYGDNIKQIFLEDVLSIEEPKEGRKFRPFDRVLVKKRDGEAWLATEFSNYDDANPLYPYTATNSCGYKYCIPYSKDLDYIIGRTDIDIIPTKAPEQ